MASHSQIPIVPLLERLGWSAEEYAGLAGFSAAFVRALIRDGTLRTVKVRRRRIITRAAGLKLLASPEPDSDPPRAA
jgi:hypothetical protein